MWVLVALAVAGCTSLPDAVLPDEAEFTVQGRLGVRADGESFAASFNWAHGAREYRIELWGPLGQGRTRLIGDPSRAGPVTVYAANGDVHVEPDGQHAMRRSLGFAVPVAALTRWIQGQPAAEFGVDDVARDDDGDLIGLAQLGWKLAFSGYRDVAEGRRVPARITAQRDDVRVTLIPKQWSFSSTFQ